MVKKTYTEEIIEGGFSPITRRTIDGMRCYLFMVTSDKDEARDELAWLKKDCEGSLYEHAKMTTMRPVVSGSIEYCIWRCYK